MTDPGRSPTALAGGRQVSPTPNARYEYTFARNSARLDNVRRLGRCSRSDDGHSPRRLPPWPAAEADDVGCIEAGRGVSRIDDEAAVLDHPAVVDRRVIRRDHHHIRTRELFFGELHAPLLLSSLPLEHLHIRVVIDHLGSLLLQEP